MPRVFASISRSARVVAALLLAFTMAPTATALAAAPRQAPPAVEAAEARRPAPVQPEQVDLVTYAEREAAAAGLEQFAGGGVGIYIGGSTLAIVLLIVLLIILL
jgi:hypothetical protein